MKPNPYHRMVCVILDAKQVVYCWAGCQWLYLDISLASFYIMEPGDLLLYCKTCIDSTRNVYRIWYFGMVG